jgi:hypothetical protein
MLKRKTCRTRGHIELIEFTAPKPTLGTVGEVRRGLLTTVTIINSESLLPEVPEWPNLEGSSTW